MTNAYSSSNPLVNSTETETDTPHVSENKPNSLNYIVNS